MRRGTRLVWKLLLALFLACTFAAMGAWAILLTTICAHPSPASAQNVIAHSCHGATAFITHFQSMLLDWLIPAELVFLFLSLIAGAVVFLSGPHVRIDVQVKRS